MQTRSLKFCCLAISLSALIILTSSCLRAGASSKSRTATATGNSMAIQNTGSDTMVNLAQAWAEEYAALRPEISVEVSGGGSGTGIAALINGTADIANSSRELEADEIARIEASAGRKPRRYVIGYDALAIFVHRDNPLSVITIEQLASIYRERGAVSRWSDLNVQVPGCASGEMILVSRQSNSGTYHYFREAILGKGFDFKLGTLDLHGSKDVVELVGRSPCAIGYSGMGYATSGVKMLRVAKSAGSEAFAPSVESAQTGDYPIARPLLMFTRGEPGPEVQRYLDWILGEQGQRIVLASGYVPLGKGQTLQAAVEGGY